MPMNLVYRKLFVLVRNLKPLFVGKTVVKDNGYYSVVGENIFWVFFDRLVE